MKIIRSAAAMGERFRRRMRRISVAAVAAALVFGGAATPAFAGPVPVQAEIVAEIIPGAPVLAGDEVTVSVTVSSEVLGGPDLEGRLIGLNYAGESIAFGLLDQGGHTEITLRPLETGVLMLEPYMSGDAEYDAVAGEPVALQVHAVPTEVELVFDESFGTPSEFGGGENFIVVSVKSDCAATASSDTDEAACIARYGYPAGELVLSRDAIEIERIAVLGSTGSAFAPRNEDLGSGINPEDTGVYAISVPVPDILLGSPASSVYDLTFVPSNWFGAAATGADVQIRAAATSVEVFVGEDLFDPQHTVYADEVEVIAFVTAESHYAAPLAGTVQFFESGTAISGPIEVQGEIPAAFAWTPTIGSGAYAITAVFTPATLNHEASESDPYPLTVIVTPAPNPTPGEVPAPNENDAEEDTRTPQQTGKTPQAALAHTGTDSSGLYLAGGFAFLAGIAALTLGAMRRHASKLRRQVSTHSR